MKKRVFRTLVSLLTAIILFQNSVVGQVASSSETEETWENYAGDLDAFVYGLIVRQYELFYDVFSAIMVLPDGTEIYGIGYSDYEGVFKTVDEEKGTVYFPAGFIPLIGEDPVPDELPDEGIQIFDAEYDNPDSSFVYAYDTEPFMQHCVIWDKYVQYGIDEDGLITYEYSPYQRGKCNESLGALYSYDEERLVFNPNLGEYINVTGISLNHEIDYQEVEDEINRILAEQDKNFWSEEIQTAVYESKDAMTSYLLSLQEERFFGYDVKELAQLTSQIDPMECIRITPDGMVMIQFEKDFWHDSNSLAKWLVGTRCLIMITGCIAVDIFIPALAPVSAAIMATAAEVFMQVVIENQALTDINWNKVAIAATSAVLMAWACPMLGANAAKAAVNLFGKKVESKLIQEIIGKTVGYAVLTMSNSFVSGVSSYYMALEDGSDSEDAINAAFAGAKMAAVCTIAASTLSEAAMPVVNKIMESHSNSWFVKALSNAGSFIDDKQLQLFPDDVEAILVPKSIHQATKEAIKQIGLQRGYDLIKCNALPSDDNSSFIKVDTKTGEILTKSEIIENKGNCILRPTSDCDLGIQKTFQKKGVTGLQVKAGEVDFGPVSEYSYKTAILSDRDRNMTRYRKELATIFSRDRSSIPEPLAEAIKINKGVDTVPQVLNGTDIRKALSTAHLTLHEGADGIVYLVDTGIHNAISHSGGVAAAQLAERLAEIRLNFTKISTSAPRVIVSTFMEEMAYE